MSNEMCSECTTLRRALEKEVEARASERAGRIRAERELRSLREPDERVRARWSQWPCAIDGRNVSTRCFGYFPLLFQPQKWHA